MGSGIWRYHPKTGTAEVVMRGLVNPWGHVFDNYGQSFATDGAGGNGINYAFVGSAYPTAVGFPRVLQGMNPGQPKHCGLEILTGSHWPEEWQGTLVTNDFRGNRINRFKLAEEGSGYVSTQMPDMLTSKHRAFRPVDLKLGPNGSLYVADWYNPIINHGEVDFRDSRRDYKHGRIWRIEVADQPPTVPPKLTDASVEELLELLKLPEQHTRHLARLEISKRRGFAVSLGLGAFTRSIPDDNYDLQLETLWTYEALGNMNSKLFEKVFNAPDHRHRAAAVRVIAHMGNKVDPKGTYLTAAIADEHPRVRLEALAALRARPSPTAAELAMSIIDKPMDKYLDFALWFTMRELQGQWFPTLAGKTPVEFQSDSKKLLFALRAIGEPKIAEPLVQLLKSDTLGESQWRDAVGLVGEFGNGEHLQQLFEIAITDEANRSAALNALVKAGQQGRRPGGKVEGLTQLADTNPQALHLAGLWEFEPLRNTVFDSAVEAGGPTQQAAIRGLAGYKDADGLREVIALEDLTVRRMAITQLATFDEKAAAAHAAQFLAELPVGQTSAAEQMVSAFLSRRTGPAELAKAVKTVSLPEPIASAAARRASSSGRRGKPLVDALRSVGSVKPMKTKLTPAELTALIAEVTSNGNPQRGENVYRRSALGCIKCHAIGGAGGVVGPDLVSLGASSPIDYIIESMLQPSAKIKEGYHTTTVLTDSGTQVSGKVISEDANNLIMRDAENKEYIIPVSSIDERQRSPTSLMPSDLVAKLPRRDFVDLIAFMTALGKEGPFKVPAQVYVRQWRTDDGKTMYSKVDGTLPAAAVKGKTATFEIEVTTPGPIALRVNAWSGLRITRNDLKDNLRAERIVQDLPIGRHRFNFAVPDRRTKPLRVEILNDPQFSGRAVPVNR